MNEENLRKRIRSLLDEIQNEADPVVLNRCRSVFRQEVSFFRRSYMAAYLLLLAEGAVEKKSVNDSHRAGILRRDSSESRFPSGNRDKKSKGLFRERKSKSPRAESNTDDFRAETPQVLSEGESLQLFVSIGRNRKVFPREILTLAIARAGISRNDIGMIRILDNYSFMQVRKSVSDAVINALDGHKFRGRTLTVNYARSRHEEEMQEDSDTESEES
jgi:hypothetical protein